MKRYRLYLIDLDRRVHRAEDLPCRSDALAIIAAEARRGESAAELWMGGRRVKVYQSNYASPLTAALPEAAPRDAAPKTRRIAKTEVPERGGK